jgi:23S rRNA (adenine2503-C2)-methyltransferase
MAIGKSLTSVFSLSPEDWSHILRELGYKPYRARQIRSWLYENKAGAFEEMSDLPQELQFQLSQRYKIFSLKLMARIFSKEDRTQKFVWSYQGRNRNEQRDFEGIFESVLIFSRESRKGSTDTDLRATACLSSQTGCLVGCAYCQTALARPVRNLPHWAMIEQYWQMAQLNDLHMIDNIVFMGMGEPFHNYRNVLRACARFTEHPGFFLHPKRITISTSGVLPRLERYLQERHAYRIAISLNACWDWKREKIIPHGKRWNIDSLTSFALNYTRQMKRRVTFEYLLLGGFNSSAEEGYALGQIFSQIPAKINLIPYNPISKASAKPDALKDTVDFRSPSEAEIDIFIQAYLKAIAENRPAQPMKWLSKKSPITVRRSQGRDIAGACGQLALASLGNRVSQSC